MIFLISKFLFWSPVSSSPKSRSFLISSALGNSIYISREGGKRRKMGGGHGHGVTYKGVTLHQPKRWHTVTGKGLCAVMWFWVLYRAKQDGPVVLGWRHPWDGHDDEHH